MNLQVFTHYMEWALAVVVAIVAICAGFFLWLKFLDAMDWLIKKVL